MSSSGRGSQASGSDAPEPYEIELRAYVPTGKRPNTWRGSNLGPSDYTLIFDTETTTDAAQTLKIGTYQVRKGEELWEAGVFVNPEILTDRELSTIRAFAAENHCLCMTVAEFIENVFFRIGYDLRATFVGLNLLFDISRVAIKYAPARGSKMKGGFSFQLSPNQYWPNIQIKHLNNRASLIRFTTRPGFISGRGMRRRKIKSAPRPGFFIDVRTLAAALTSRSFDLAGLATFLGTEHRKLSTDEHGRHITDDYLMYAMNDVQVTWESYCGLLRKFAQHDFKATLPHRIFSEAGIGKAYFREMNIQPWREVQPHFPDDITGIIMSTYFGGRAEVHHRRMISQVCYCDFLSMYPTVCTIMQLWGFVIAQGIRWRDNTEETQHLLASITLDDLRYKCTWPLLTTLVRVIPDADIFPVRADYGQDEQATIGLNYFSSETPLWFTLADCIAAKLLTGKAPTVVRAIIFEPGEPQPSLKPVTIAGNSDYQIDPYRDDFYKRIIDLRSSVKRRLQNADPSEHATLDSDQLTLKILANATSYGNFVELNVEELLRPQKRVLHGFSGEPQSISTDKGEEPGRYFHPLLATLITGGARLKLAITERLIESHGLDWAFCDTDSMAIAKPTAMPDAEFFAKVDAIREWFEPLNPYADKIPILKIEEANFKVENSSVTRITEPLFCYAISSKRYALFNIGPDGRIILRKASAHGLGHLLPPYEDTGAPACIPIPAIPLANIGVERWQYDLWHQIIRAALDGHPDQVDLGYHPNLSFPAASRYAATTPRLLRWFNAHNAKRAYADQVKPSNFLLAFQTKATSTHPAFTETTPKPVAPHNRDPRKAAKLCFDRDTGIPIPAKFLKTYAEALAQYHLRPEYKFLNGDYTDQGITRRRHVRAIAIRHIGKESNRWEEQFFVGNDEGADIDYGVTAGSRMTDNALRNKIIAIGQRKVARESGTARRTIERFLAGKRMRANIQQRIISVLRPFANRRR
jgi:hypothetical protein